MVSPALAVEPATPPTSAVLVKSMVAQLTVMLCGVSLVFGLPALLEVSDAERFVKVPQVPDDVVAVTCTLKVPVEPWATVRGWVAKLRTSGVVPVMMNSLGVVLGARLSMPQLRPAGRLS